MKHSGGFKPFTKVTSPLGSRVAIRWIRSNMIERNVLPIFQPSHENVMDDVDALCSAIEQIERTTTEMAVVPAAFEREMQTVQV